MKGLGGPWGGVRVGNSNHQAMPPPSVILLLPLSKVELKICEDCKCFADEYRWTISQGHCTHDMCVYEICNTFHPMHCPQPQNWCIILWLISEIHHPRTYYINQQESRILEWSQHQLGGRPFITEGGRAGMMKIPLQKWESFCQFVGHGIQNSLCFTTW